MVWLAWEHTSSNVDTALLPYSIRFYLLRKVTAHLGTRRIGNWYLDGTINAVPGTPPDADFATACEIKPDAPRFKVIRLVIVSEKWAHSVYMYLDIVKTRIMLFDRNGMFMVPMVVARVLHAARVLLNLGPHWNGAPVGPSPASLTLDHVDGLGYSLLPRCSANGPHAYISNAAFAMAGGTCEWASLRHLSGMMTSTVYIQGPYERNLPTWAELLHALCYAWVVRNGSEPHGEGANALARHILRLKASDPGNRIIQIIRNQGNETMNPTISALHLSLPLMYLDYLMSIAGARHAPGPAQARLDTAAADMSGAPGPRVQVSPAVSGAAAHVGGEYEGLDTLLPAIFAGIDLRTVKALHGTRICIAHSGAMPVDMSDESVASRSPIDIADAPGRYADMTVPMIGSFEETLRF